MHLQLQDPAFDVAQFALAPGQLELQEHWPNFLLCSSAPKCTTTFCPGQGPQSYPVQSWQAGGLQGAGCQEHFEQCSGQCQEADCGLLGRGGL